MQILLVTYEKRLAQCAFAEVPLKLEREKLWTKVANNSQRSERAAQSDRIGATVLVRSPNGTS
jgi:hypothetical protein